mgnify:CR=1 FL=1
MAKAPNELSDSRPSIITLSLELIATAIDASVTGIIITDNLQPDNPIIYCNLAFEQLTGYDRKEIIGHNCRFLQREDRGQAQRGMLKKAVAQGENIVVEIRNYKKDGTLFHNELHVSAVKNELGEVTNFIGIQHDITDRKKVEDDLVRANKNMEAKIKERTRTLEMEREFTDSILETVRESLLVLDVNLNVLSVNPHFLRTFKVSRIDTEQHSLYDLGNGQWDIEKLRFLLEQVLPTNNPVLDFEVQHDFPHIGKKIMLLNAYRIELEGAYKNRILLAIEDITERRAIEQRKDDFLSIASHELKTPLTTVKGYIQMLGRLMPNDADKQFKTILERADQNVERLNKLITELLDVSRIQSGHIELHMSEFNFDAMVQETVEGIQNANASHHIKVTGSVSELVHGDESHLAQVVTNLLSNAIKYSPNANEIVMHVSTVSNYVKVSVQDFGLGIGADEQAKIFERFYRVDATQKKFPGMGIGLYICDQIIKNHHGTLWVDSERGTGSIFSFTIPIQQNIA